MTDIHLKCWDTASISGALSSPVPCGETGSLCSGRPDRNDRCPSHRDRPAFADFRQVRAPIANLTNNYFYRNRLIPQYMVIPGDNDLTRPDHAYRLLWCILWCMPCFTDRVCKGCRLGYDRGERDIRAARCAIKRCCFADRNLQTCADCPDFTACGTIQDFYAKNGHKYRKYRESLEFIRRQGYPAFLLAASSWKGAYGSLE